MKVNKSRLKKKSLSFASESY